jgi:uncharacterized membrane protein
MITRRRSNPLAIIFITLWLLTLIGTPIAMWVRGDAAVVPMIIIGVLMQIAVVALVFWRAEERRSSFRSILLIIPLAWLVEFAGSTTGVPFGPYVYTKALQPQLGGVPLIIPLAWLMMLPPAWGIAAMVVKNQRYSSTLLVRLIRSGVAAVAFTVWDLFLDPQMVAWGFWTWAKPGAYFGIPLVNFLGWILVSFVFTFLLLPDHLPTASLVYIYTVTWFLLSLGQLLFWDLPGPALSGFLGMGGVVLWAHLKRKK